jgi:hypothetical protein
MSESRVLASDVNIRLEETMRTSDSRRPSFQYDGINFQFSTADDDWVRAKLAS